MYKLTLFVLLFLINLVVFSQTHIEVEESDFKNEKIIFYSFSDYITQQKDTIFIVQANEKGGFSVTVDLETTKELFTDLGVYHCSFYAEPNRKQYELNLPEKKNITKAEELNIFFKPIDIRLGIKNNPKRDLNLLISSFDKIYITFLAQKFDTIYHSPQSDFVEIFEKEIQNYYSEVEHEFFKSYIYYKISELKFIGPNRSYKTITFNHYNNKRIQYYNPAYMQLFNLMYEDFFNLYVNSSDGKLLENVISEGRSIKKLIKILDKSVALSDPALEEFIALKGIHDEVMNSRRQDQIRFKRPQLKIILDSIAEFSTISEHRKIAKNIISKVTHNKRQNLNQDIPSFKLLNIDGSVFSSDSLKGKYVYLNFMRTDIVPAMESMDRLVNFYNTHKEDIEIVSIFTDDDLSKFQALDTNLYPWHILHIGEQRQLLEFYNLITWPQFHLISPEGKLIVSPAASLKENFEVKFFEMMDLK